MADAKSYIQHASHLVNIGAHFFSIGDDYQAYEAFKRALDILQGVAKEFDDQMTAEPSDTGTVDDNECPLPLLAIPLDCRGDKKLVLDTLEEEDKSYYFIYGQAFVIDTRSLDVSYTPIYLAIVIFNMTHLLLRRAQHEQVKSSLAKALRLYDLALLLLRSAPRHLDASDVTMALLNNKIYVCYCLHEFAEAHAALEEFSDLLAVNCDSEGVFDEPELNEMVLNTLLPLDPTKLAPAA